MTKSEFQKGDSVFYGREIKGRISHYERSEVLCLTVVESNGFCCKGKVVFCDDVSEEFDYVVGGNPGPFVTWDVREISPAADVENVRDRNSHLAHIARLMYRKHRQQFDA